MTCDLCGKTALRVVGRRFFCGDHYKQAVEAQTQAFRREERKMYDEVRDER